MDSSAHQWRQPDAQVLRWESSAKPRTPLPQDDKEGR